MKGKIILALLLVGILMNTAFAATTVSLSDSSIHVGETFNVVVKTDTLFKRATGAEIRLDYDQTKLQLIKTTQGDLLFGCPNTISVKFTRTNQAGLAYVCTLNKYSNTSGLTYATYTFKAVKRGATTVTVEPIQVATAINKWGWESTWTYVGGETRAFTIMR